MDALKFLQAARLSHGNVPALMEAVAARADFFMDNHFDSEALTTNDFLEALELAFNTCRECLHPLQMDSLNDDCHTRAPNEECPVPNCRCTR